jgi:hypothetical protein
MGEHRRSLRASAPAPWCRDVSAAAVHQMVAAWSLGGGRPYLWAAVLARGAHDVVRDGRRKLAHAVFADFVFLRIVFNLWWG